MRIIGKQTDTLIDEGASGRSYIALSSTLFFLLPSPPTVQPGREQFSLRRHRCSWSPTTTYTLIYSQTFVVMSTTPTMEMPGAEKTMRDVSDPVFRQ